MNAVILNFASFVLGFCQLWNSLGDTEVGTLCVPLLDMHQDFQLYELNSANIGTQEGEKNLVKS